MSISTVIEQIREAQEDYESSEEGLSVNADITSSARSKIDNIQHEIDQLNTEFFEFKHTTAQRFSHVDEELSRIEKMLQYDESEYFQENKKIHLKERFEGIESNQEKLYEFLKRQAEKDEAQQKYLQKIDNQTQKTAIDTAKDVSSDEKTPTIYKKLEEKSSIVLEGISSALSSIKKSIGTLLARLGLTALGESAAIVGGVAAATVATGLAAKAIYDKVTEPPKISGELTAYTKTTPYDESFKSAEEKYGLPPGLLKNTAYIESEFNPRAMSNTGNPKYPHAYGVMQLIPQTGERYGAKSIEELYQPNKAIDTGGKYYKFLLKHYDGDLQKTVAAYNTGEGNVDNAIKKAEKSGGDWKDYLPVRSQTIPHIAQVMIGSKQPELVKHAVRELQAIGAPRATKKKPIESLFQETAQEMPQTETISADQSPITAVETNETNSTIEHPEEVSTVTPEQGEESDPDGIKQQKQKQPISQIDQETIDILSKNTAKAVSILGGDDFILGAKKLDEIIQKNDKAEIQELLKKLSNQTALRVKEPDTKQKSKLGIEFGSSYPTSSTTPTDKISVLEQYSENQNAIIPVILPTVEKQQPQQKILGQNVPNPTVTRSSNFPDVRNNEATYMNILMANFNTLFPNFVNNEV